MRSNEGLSRYSIYASETEMKEENNLQSLIQIAFKSLRGG